MVKEAVFNAGISMGNISFMGICSPGMIDPTNGIIKFANNLEFFDVPITSMLKERLGVNFYLENDDGIIGAAFLANLYK